MESWRKSRANPREQRQNSCKPIERLKLAGCVIERVTSITRLLQSDSPIWIEVSLFCFLYVGLVLAASSEQRRRAKAPPIIKLISLLPFLSPSNCLSFSFLSTGCLISHEFAPDCPKSVGVFSEVVCLFFSRFFPPPKLQSAAHESRPLVSEYCDHCLCLSLFPVDNRDNRALKWEEFLLMSDCLSPNVCL